MDINDNIESPFDLKVSFKKLIEHYESVVDSKDRDIVKRAKLVLKTAEKFPELKEGFTDLNVLKEREKEIEFILKDSFNPMLTLNEIKTASIPFHSMIFNSSERFKNIVKAAGEDFELEIKNMPKDDVYIIACTIILSACYGYNLNFKRPFFYEIPDAEGIMRYYKILYNADFTEIMPTDSSKKITPEDIDMLLDNFDNIEVWKEKFPPNSYIFKGFVISNIFDVTDDQSISNIKSILIGGKKRESDDIIESFHNVFRSLFGLKDIRVGFSTYNKEERTFERLHGVGMQSFLLNSKEKSSCDVTLCKRSYNTLLNEKQFYTVSDVDKYYELSKGKAPQYAILKEQGIQSAILAPIAENNELLGILELVSDKPKVLNSINANKLIDIMPFIVTAVKRSKKDEENLIEAIIQKECTSIHPSVHWKFKAEAKNFILDDMEGKEPNFKKIAFDKIYPLYGQIDIKGSSQARNWATQEDLRIQLTLTKNIVEHAYNKEGLPLYEQFLFQIDEHLDGLKEHFQVDSEQQISAFIHDELDPLFEHLANIDEFKQEIESYYSHIDENLNVLYQHRKDYDETISMINAEMAMLLDKKQITAQRMYPHYFERFKTDGVEHNMYIGESITKDESYNSIYLYNLRLWQLQVMCEMENAYYQMQSDFSIQLDVASMILVFSQPLTISFRMDEKHFDVDGTYNARYEIVKKRVDKAHIKGTDQRVTEKGKLAIVYSQKQDEIEYLRYIRFLQSKNYLDDDVEIVELDDLQAVTGLKAIRVSILYHREEDDKEVYTYDDLMKEIKA